MSVKSTFFTYTVEAHCIACTTCSTMSPNVFAVDVPSKMAMVIQQPTNAMDNKTSFWALKSCPVHAIKARS